MRKKKNDSSKVIRHQTNYRQNYWYVIEAVSVLSLDFILTRITESLTL